MQIGLFASQPAKPLPPPSPRLTAKNAKRILADLRTQLAAAEADLADCEYNLEYVAMHQRASCDGIVDENWWDGAIRFGIWHNEEGMTIRDDGRYPVKVLRWIRHLLRELHAERRDIRAAIADLKPKVQQMAALIGEKV